MQAVRFTNENGVSEGAMYDRVTRKLFGNAGTGAFVLGPDVATPVMGLRNYPETSAKSYIQDGLVAMWDGIENAGWGVHDASATVWKDLVGDYDFMLNNAATINPDSIYCDGTQAAGNTGRVINLPIVTMEIACRYLDSSSNTALFMTGAVESSWYREVFGISDSNRQFLFANRGIGYKDTFSHSWSFNLDNLNWHKDGIAQSPPLEVRTLDADAGRGYIGRVGGTGNVACECSVYGVRLYSRALTAAEVAYNYSIDKARFNLP